jgi:hypothetical protein
MDGRRWLRSRPFNALTLLHASLKSSAGDAYTNFQRLRHTPQLTAL